MITHFAKFPPIDSIHTMNSSENPSSTPKPVISSEKPQPSSAASVSERLEPIPPPSHPKQYRAIGLIRGKYQPSEEQITQGTLVTADGTQIEAVLLGRIISLVKKHLDLDKEHLWVVYPRTKVKDDLLHVQIVGVWEPETLAQDETKEIAPPEEIQENYFSIRGELVFFDRDNEVLVVKIKQFPRKEGDKPKSFKLKLKGVLDGKPLKRFWDLNVNLEGETLVVPAGTGTDLGFAQRKPRGKKKFDNNRKPFSKSPRPVKPVKSGVPKPKPKINKPST